MVGILLPNFCAISVAFSPVCCLSKFRTSCSLEFTVSFTVSVVTLYFLLNTAVNIPPYEIQVQKD